MQIGEFKRQLQECMNQTKRYIKPAIAYHELEEGDIYINVETGTFSFSDSVGNYLPSRLNLDNVANLRWGLYYDDQDKPDEDNAESSITIHFCNGDSIRIYYWHWNYNEEILIYFRGEDAKEEKERLERSCTKKWMKFYLPE